MRYSQSHNIRLMQVLLFSFLVLFMLTQPVNATLKYEYTSLSDPTTYGTITIDAKVGDIYLPNDIVDYDFTVLGTSFTEENSRYYSSSWGGSGFRATDSDPFGDLRNDVGFLEKSPDYWSVDLSTNEVMLTEREYRTGGWYETARKTVSDITWKLRFSLAFPIDGYQSDTAPISSVFDHSGSPYTKDGLVYAYTGEVGDCQYGISRYKAKDGTVKKFEKAPKDEKEKNLEQACSELKSGEIGSNGYLYAYQKEDLTQIGVVDGRTNFKTSPDYTTTMYYDGHAGYDYPVGSVITAAAEGTLCLAKLESSSTGSGEWRNSSKCPYGKDDINTSEDSWAKFHTFYIVHPGTENLSTWYLHASSLDPVVLASISAQGYADVSKGDVVATMGGYGNGKQDTFGKHLHFEVRRDGSTLIDPYGWNGSPVLWE